MTRTSDEAPEPVTEHLRGADLRARAPQSAIPTQGGPPLPPPRSGPFPMGPRVVGPPSGPAQRSPLVTPQGRPTPQHPSGEQTPLQDDGSVPVKLRLGAWGRQLREVVSTPTGRWSVIGVVAVLQVFLLFSTVMWWAGGGSTVTASAKLAPMTWTGIVYDVGAAGVNLRSATTVTPDSAKDTAARGSRLAVSCGQTGDVVQKGTVNTATWLKTTDGLFVSMLYVRVPDRQSIPSCADSTVDAPLLALADPTNPDLPPPPGTALGSEDDTSGTQAAGGGTANRAKGAASGGLVAPAVPPGSTPVPSAVAPRDPAPGSRPTIGTGSATTTTTAPPMTTATNDYNYEPDPNTTPVG
ncbi:hypothetical protein [Actinomycetospora sp. CA-084318]|uniref:hypothetical protein n=1 Tax=Actinomycetospora sp. CA-084318 TaxID=3239892 RepID=UPI003D9749CB